MPMISGTAGTPFGAVLATDAGLIAVPFGPSWIARGPTGGSEGIPPSPTGRLGTSAAAAAMAAVPSIVSTATLGGSGNGSGSVGKNGMGGTAMAVAAWTTAAGVA